MADKILFVIVTKGKQNVASKRYQVFVSSTYEDLLEERKQVMQALLESECIPAGMELFPAADDDAWTLIKRVIDESDYYILILAGRYGSTNNDGMGYTEMEYRYALDTGKPIISFLHQDPDELPVSRTDKEPTERKRLESFRTLVRNKVVKYWSTPSELGAIAGRSIEKLKKDKPTSGWIKGDIPRDQHERREIDLLHERIQQLQRELSYVNTPIEERPDVLIGSTYKIKTPLSDHALYVTINDIIVNQGAVDEHRRPFEIILASKNMDHFQWIVALTRIISMNFRKGVEIPAIVDELLNIYDPRGGYFKSGGVFMPSLIAELGAVINSHYENLGNKK